MKNNLKSKLMEQANLGLFYLYESISQKVAVELRNKGFTVTDSHESKNFPHVHRICWREVGFSVIDYDPVDILDENNPKYSLAQKLWIISEKNQPSFKYLYGR